MKHGWEIKKLGEICDIICGQDYKSIKDDDGKYPIYGTGGIMGYASQYRCPANSVIIGRKGNINNPIYVETEFWNVDTAFGVVPKSEIIHSKFFYLFCKDYDFTKHDVSVTIPSLRRTDIIKIDVPVPPIAEQEKIVAELDCLSGIIEKKKQQLKEYDALAQSIFYEMFGDPVENEKGWETEKLSNKAEISSSKRIFASEYTENGVPFYRGKEVTEKSKGNPISVELFISKERYEEIKSNYGIPVIGDILVTAVGTIGNIWVVDSDEEFYFKDGNVLWLKIRDNTNPIYFKFILTILIDEYKEMMANGCAYSALTIANLKEMPTCVTPLALQQQFASKIEAIEKQKAIIKKSIEEVETLFNSRMDYYFT